MSESDNPVETGPWKLPESQLACLDAVESEQPRQIGRYRVDKLLGHGGFGRVYLAYDDQLNRPVAIKLPHPERVARPEGVENYLAEARILASLDHPNIVPVFDVGCTEKGLPFVVSKFIEGSDLAQRIKGSRFSFAEAADLVGSIADGLHHAHRKGLVHRDVKPGNILLDAGGKPYVADFGLALREEDFGKGATFAGTPAFMSPEQARGEGHRVDGRSDIFSLGVVFYELLTGRRPFKGDSREQLLEQIALVEARPPRQLDDTIPKELERICLKALAKRASERYTTAKDLADDLRHFLASASELEKSLLGGKAAGDSPPAATPVPTSPVPTSASDRKPIQIVPKGLRSFDAGDMDFFLELLPGPRDREGLPESIRFWKTRIEETDADKTFPVGLIYGPSGCGKSSLVKAGLLPRLSDHVLVVYVEATAEGTEARLVKELQKAAYPGLAPSPDLTETLAALRRGRDIDRDRKVLLVLDQFEQWLHAKRHEEGPKLVRALRQCDGAGVQCVVMVRDDFWLSVSRFMRELEVRLVEGQNSALVDLFDLRHAKKVLAAFGRALGGLPEKAHELTKQQRGFLDQAVAGLAQEGKLVPVRLALFAEMVKGRPWTPATLKEVGGIEGIGVTFFEETFSASSAPPEHRYHEKAAKALLKALLPEPGTDIKGHLRSYNELLEASGYGSRAKDFDELLYLLDTQLRLITPTDVEERTSGECRGDERPRLSAPEQPASKAACGYEAGQRYYQLTHDYLVPSLREWLTRKQKETRRGRAELRLAELAAAWKAKPEKRHLPAWWEWANIRLLTRKKTWTEPQRKMMRHATKYHTVRGMVLAAALVTVGLTLAIAAMFAASASLREAREKRLRGIAERERAQADTLRAVARRFVYFSHINLADRAWQENQLSRMHELLQEHQAKDPSHQDCPGFEWYYLWRLLHRSSLLTFKGHTRTVFSVAFSPDGKRLASTSSDQTIRVWDAASGQEALCLKGHTSTIYGVAFSPDGQRLASAAGDQTVRIWDATTGHNSLTLKAHDKAFFSVAFSPDGQRLASNSEAGTVIVWNLVTGQEVLKFNHSPSVWSSNVVFSPDGKRLATPSSDKTVKLWDAFTGKEVMTLRGHTQAPRCVAFCRDGQSLASASGPEENPGEIIIWDLATRQKRFTLTGHGSMVWSLAFSPDGKRLASASADRTIVVWDTATGHKVFSLKGHGGQVTSVTFSPDGQRLATASSDRTAKVWDATATPKEAITLMGHNDEVASVAFSPDGQWLASASFDHTVKLWDTTTCREALTLKGHASAVTGVVFSPDGRRLASASFDRTVRVWDLATHRELFVFKGHTEPVMCVAFNPSGHRLASASWDQTVKVWDTTTGGEALTLKGHASAVRGVAFSPDGQRLASASWDQTVKVWDATTGREALTLKGHTSDVFGVAFSPDGRRLASASSDHSVKVWDTATGKEILTLIGHAEMVNGVAFSPDGNRLATASADQTVKIWDAATGQEALTLKGHRGQIMSVTFSPDGHRLASAGHDQTVKIWDATPMED